MVLSLLMHAPQHGYQIKTALKRLKPNNNKIYPLLRRLTEQGYLTKENVEQDGLPGKTIYSITDAGRDYFLGLLSDYPEAKAHDAEEFFLRVSYFPSLSPAVRATILDRRLRALEAENGEFMLREDDPNEGILYDDATIRAFIRKRNVEEIKYIDYLKLLYQMN